jgi:hypothetical protein
MSAGMHWTQRRLARSSSKMIGRILDTENTASAIFPLEGCNYERVQLYSTAVADIILQHHLALVHPVLARKKFTVMNRGTLPGD